MRTKLVSDTTPKTTTTALPPQALLYSNDFRQRYGVAPPIPVIQRRIYSREERVDIAHSRVGMSANSLHENLQEILFNLEGTTDPNKALAEKHILLFGPGKYAKEIDLLLPFKNIATLHIVDMGNGVIDQLNVSLLRENNRREQPINFPPMFGYDTDIQHLIDTLDGKIDYVIDCCVINPKDFKYDSQVEVASRISRLLKPFGIHISEGAVGDDGRGADPFTPGHYPQNSMSRVSVPNDPDKAKELSSITLFQRTKDSVSFPQFPTPEIELDLSIITNPKTLEAIIKILDLVKEDGRNPEVAWNYDYPVERGARALGGLKRLLWRFDWTAKEENAWWWEMMGGWLAKDLETGSSPDTFFKELEGGITHNRNLQKIENHWIWSELDQWVSHLTLEAGQLAGFFGNALGYHLRGNLLFKDDSRPLWSIFREGISRNSTKSGSYFIDMSYGMPDEVSTATIHRFKRFSHILTAIYQIESSYPNSSQDSVARELNQLLDQFPKTLEPNQQGLWNKLLGLTRSLAKEGVPISDTFSNILSPLLHRYPDIMNPGNENKLTTALTIRQSEAKATKQPNSFMSDAMDSIKLIIQHFPSPNFEDFNQAFPTILLLLQTYGTFNEKDNKTNSFLFYGVRPLIRNKPELLKITERSTFEYFLKGFHHLENIASNRRKTEFYAMIHQKMNERHLEDTVQFLSRIGTLLEANSPMTYQVINILDKNGYQIETLSNQQFEKVVDTIRGIKKIQIKQLISNLKIN